MLLGGHVVGNDRERFVNNLTGIVFEETLNEKDFAVKLFLHNLRAFENFYCAVGHRHPALLFPRPDQEVELFHGVQFRLRRPLGSLSPENDECEYNSNHEPIIRLGDYSLGEVIIQSMVLLTAIGLATVLQGAVAPDADNYQQWLKFIQPDAKEQAYKEIDWRNQFWPAVQEAKILGRPILFWIMNGHPLGCT